MPFPVIRRAIERLPKTVGFVNAFGQTETTSTLTVLGPEDHRLDGGPAEVERTLRRLRSIGRPLPDVEVRIVDDDGERAGTERGGRDPRAHAARDEGLRRREGTRRSPPTAGCRRATWAGSTPDGYLYVAGRKDDMIIRGGENIAPAEVEAVLGAHPAVEEVAVVGLPDVEWGQRVGAFVVLRPGAQATAEELGEFCRAAPGELQEARGHPLPPRAAEEPDGQGAPPRAARAGRGRVSRHAGTRSRSRDGGRARRRLADAGTSGTTATCSTTR